MKLATLVVLVAACGSDGPPPDPAWMTPLDDTASIASLTIPGTHDSGAMYDLANSGTAKTQNMTIAEQLKAGVRFLDMRCRHMDDLFRIYHGPVYQQQTFDDVLATVNDFLDEHPKQTIVMGIKEEFTPENTTRTFSQTFEAYVALAPDRWYLGSSIPTLGDARGKIILLRRFATTTMPLGLDGSMWKDDTTFTLNTPDATMRIQDDYNVSDVELKWTEITGMFDEAKTGAPATLFVNYTSGFKSNSGIPNTPEIANDINARLNLYYMDPANATGRLGIVASDLATESHIRYLVAHNVAAAP